MLFFSIHQRQQVRNNTKTPTQRRSGSSRMSQEPTFSGKFHFHRKKVIARITAALSADPEQRFLNCAKKKEKSLALDRWEISPHQGGDRRTSVKSWYEVEIRAEEMWNCRKWYAWNLPQLTKGGRRGKRDGGVGCVVWFGVRYEEKGGQGKRGRQKDMRGRGGMSNWYNDQQWWGEEGVTRQRTAEREREGGCGTATVVWREYRKERRRKWENLINEIILQSTSIRLHSAATVHMSRQPARQAGRGQKGVRIIRRKKDQRVDESFSVSLVITKVSARPSLFSASIITVQVGKSLHKSGPRLRRSHMTHRPLNRAAPAPRLHVRLGCNWVSLAAANCAKLFYSI